MVDVIFDVKYYLDIWVILLKGYGDCFIVGNDIQDFVSKEESEYVVEIVVFMCVLMDCEKLVIV